MTFALFLHFVLSFCSNLIDSDFIFYFALLLLSLFQIVFRRTETFVALGLLFVLGLAQGADADDAPPQPRGCGISAQAGGREARRSASARLHERRAR